MDDGLLWLWLGKLEKDLRNMEEDVRALPLSFVGFGLWIGWCHALLLVGTTPTIFHSSHPPLPQTNRTKTKQQGERLRAPKVPNGFPKREYSVRSFGPVLITYSVSL